MVAEAYHAQRRCRFSKQRSIERMLGRADTSNAGSGVEESEFSPVDIVVNWIGEQVALAFFHAVLGECPASVRVAWRCFSAHGTR